MKIEVIRCTICGWEHEEIDVQSAIPAALFGAFSDPAGLERIMRVQRRERQQEAINAHMATHPDFRGDDNGAGAFALVPHAETEGRQT